MYSSNKMVVRFCCFLELKFEPAGLDCWIALKYI